MASTSKKLNGIPERTRGMPSAQAKEQYESLLSETDTQSLNHDDLHVYSRRHIPWRSPFFYVPTILSVLLGIALVAVCSSNAARLDSVLSQMEEKVSSLKAISESIPQTHESHPIDGVPETHVKTSKPTGEEFGSCGNSPGEAQSLGCVFDPMSWAWQRPECYNVELINDFLNKTDWHFYPNNATRPKEELPREVWARGGYNGAWGACM
ncbi:hypothetical protein F4776DRAFT_649443 [Hypoxylon sp. NC0597]|nr:hypothetical protein F4776DRAFT_649443 [Hypoxylon sp. NC0597]